MVLLYGLRRVDGHIRKLCRNLISLHKNTASSIQSHFDYYLYKSITYTFTGF
jgi:hypothetical protein